MLKGLLNYLPPSDDQIRQHEDQRRQRDERRSNVESMSFIVDHLRDKYVQHKHDFVLLRYGALKRMIKSANGSFENAKLEKSVEPVNQRSLVGLVENVEKLCESMEKTKQTAEMSREQLEQEIESYRREIVQLDNDGFTMRTKLESLRDSYTLSKRMFPFQRYSAMKCMIKQTISKE